MRHRLLVLVTLWMLEAKMSIEAMKQALEFLEENQHLIADNERHAYVMQYNAFIEELEAAINQEEKREWVGLTDEDIVQEFGFVDELLRDCVYRTETKLKEKNT